MAHKSKSDGGYAAKINQLGPGKPTRKNIFSHTPGSKGLSGKDLDDTLRNSFPNMGKTPTGTKHQ